VHTHEVSLVSGVEADARCLHSPPVQVIQPRKVEFDRGVSHGQLHRRGALLRHAKDRNRTIRAVKLAVQWIGFRRAKSDENVVE
jgi:hypothetical protein